MRQQRDAIEYDPADRVLRATKGILRQGFPKEERFSYYAADEQLRAADWRYTRDGLANTWVFEQHRYDAPGRRVWTQANRE